jgi:hypothetical protein
MGERARERVLRFDWDHAATALERVLRAAAAPRETADADAL